MIIKWSLRVYN